MNIQTHVGINTALSGTPVSLSPGRATVDLATTETMCADAHGLVHGGFVFSAADYAAMLAVNDPNVVLGQADCRFVAPVRVGSTVRIQAEITETKGRKRVVSVSASVGDKVVLTGTLTTFVLDQHVLQG